MPNWEECRKESEIIGAKLQELIKSLEWNGSEFYCEIYLVFFDEKYASIKKRLESSLNASVSNDKDDKVRDYYSTETLENLIYIEGHILEYIEENYDSISENNLKPEDVIQKASELISSEEYKVKPVTFKEILIN